MIGQGMNGVNKGTSHHSMGEASLRLASLHATLHTQRGQTGFIALPARGEALRFTTHCAWMFDCACIYTRRLTHRGVERGASLRLASLHAAEEALRS